MARLKYEDAAEKVKQAAREAFPNARKIATRSGGLHEEVHLLIVADEFDDLPRYQVYEHAKNEILSRLDADTQAQFFLEKVYSTNDAAKAAMW